ncbi:MAG: hypothetical protein EBS90_11950, partial [Betaproteobacteria bacterium]|nr:hypothetical protein [Betaproteobacteria bacterium]
MPESLRTIDRIEALAWIVVESMPIASPHKRPLRAATDRMKRKTSSKTSFGSRLCVLLTQEWFGTGSVGARPR